MLERLRELAAERADFAFESTLAGEVVFAVPAGLEDEWLFRRVVLFLAAVGGLGRPTGRNSGSKRGTRYPGSHDPAAIRDGVFRNFWTGYRAAADSGTCTTIVESVARPYGRGSAMDDSRW